jgi:hypothetical protein
MPLTDQDKSHLNTLSMKLPMKPKYGNDNWYTVAAGGWSPPLARDKLVNIQRAISGEDVGRLPSWAHEITESGAKKDAEVHLVLAYNDELQAQTGSRPDNTPKGTLYIVVDKGPCRSCRRVLSALRKYWGFRMVIKYSGGKTVPGRVGQMGYESAEAFPSGGYYVLFE